MTCKKPLRLSAILGLACELLATHANRTMIPCQDPARVAAQVGVQFRRTLRATGQDPNRRRFAKWYVPAYRLSPIDGKPRSKNRTLKIIYPRVWPRAPAWSLSAIKQTFYTP